MKLFEFTLFQRGITFWLLVFPLTWALGFITGAEHTTILHHSLPATLAFFLATLIAYPLWNVQVKRESPKKQSQRLVYIFCLVPIIVYSIYVGANAAKGGLSISQAEFSTRGFMLSVLAAALPAIAEELFFRKFLMDVLDTRFHAVWTITISALLFTLVHSSNPSSNILSQAGVLSAGLFFALLYRVSESLIPCIIAHLTWNVVAGPVMGHNISGLLVEHVIFRTDVDTAAWLGGGAFGPEASLVSIFSWLLATGLLYKKAAQWGAAFEKFY